MNSLKNFFNGNIRSITKDIKEKLENCIINENFEYAATLRDIYFHLEQITENQNVVLDPKIN